VNHIHFLIVAGVVAMAACTDKAPAPSNNSKAVDSASPSGSKQTTKITKPDESSIKPKMIKFARSVVFLDNYLADWQERKPARETVLPLLQQIKMNADSLVRVETMTKHPVLSQRLPILLSNVEDALRDVKKEPPDYTMARALIGACNECHDYKKCAFDPEFCD